MAVEYDRWTDERTVSAQTAEELQEIVGDHMTISYVADISAIEFKADDNNKLQLSKVSDKTNAWINGTKRVVLSYTSTPSIKYFAKRSGEILITSANGTGTGSLQIAIGQCSDGSWGAAAVSMPQTNAKYDSIFLICKDAPPYDTTHYITNADVPNKMYLCIRKIVLREEVTFNNMYVNNYGYTDPFSVIEMNGERYASAKGETGNHVCFLMKL